MARAGRGGHDRPGMLLMSGREHDAVVPSRHVLAGIVCRPTLCCPVQGLTDPSSIQRMAALVETGTRAPERAPQGKRLYAIIHNDNNVLLVFCA